VLKSGESLSKTKQSTKKPENTATTREKRKFKTIEQKKKKKKYVKA